VRHLVKLARDTGYEVLEGARLKCPPLGWSSSYFRVQIVDYGIHIVSEMPVAFPHTDVISSSSESARSFNALRFFSAPSDGTEECIDAIVAQIRRVSYYSRLYRLWWLLVSAMATVSMPRFYALFYESRIEFYFFDRYIFSIELSPETAELQISQWIGIPDSVFFASLECGECRRVEILRSVLLYSMAKLICDSLEIRMSHPMPCILESTGTLGLHLSYAPEYVIVFGDRRGLPAMWIRGDKQVVSTQETIMLETRDVDNLARLTEEAARSALMAVILLQCEQSAKRQGCPARLENGCAHFVCGLFECIEFGVRPDGYWKLACLKPPDELPSVRFVGRTFPMRFTEFIVRTASETAALVNILRQVRGVDSMKTVIRSLTVFDEQTEFAVRVKQAWCTSISMGLSGISHLDSEKRICEVGHFTPQMRFDFGRQIPLRNFFQHLLRTQSVSYCFGAFLSSSFIALHRFFTVFFEGRGSVNWTVTALRDDHSFFLIFARLYSMNLMLRPGQQFQLIIPSVGESQVLQIPIESLPQQSRLTRSSHTSLHLHLSQLEQLKMTIENFFACRKKLSEMGMGDWTWDGQTLSAPFPGPELHLRCHLKVGGFEFRVDDDNQRGRALAKLMNAGELMGVAGRMMMINFVLNLLEFEWRFVDMVILFVLKLMDMTSEIGINWQQTLGGATVVMAKERKLLLVIASRIYGDFRVEFTGGEDLNGVSEIVAVDRSNGYSTMRNWKDLIKWVQSLDPLETDGP
jgi:hypothetical protein